MSDLEWGSVNLVGALQGSADSIRLFQIGDQLLFQVAPRGFFDGAPLSRDCLLLRLPFSSCPCFDRLRQMRDLRALHTNFALLWSCVRIHYETWRLLFATNSTGKAESWSNTETSTTARIDLSYSNPIATLPRNHAIP